MNISLKIFIISLLGFLTSCSSTPYQTHSLSESTPFALNPSVSTVGTINHEDPIHNREDSTSAYGHISFVQNKHVDKWLHYYQNRGRRHMLRYLQRSTRYIELMKAVLREEGLPEDLVYLPIIESGFSPSAHSFAGAVGYWQFIRGTATRYGLKVNSLVDERQDPVLSTRAAALYFKALYSLFGDWYLALASYNTGENRVKRVVMKTGTRDFWKISKKLPRETRNYIPKFLAATAIAKDPHRYGFIEVDYKPKLVYDKLYVKRPVSLVKLAKNMRISYKSLKRMNPRYRTDHVPIYRGRQSLVRVPKGRGKEAASLVMRSLSSKPKIYDRAFVYYKVKSGDTLSQIADRHKVRLLLLRSENNFSRKKSFIRVGQRLRVPTGLRNSRASKRMSKKLARRSRTRRASVYKVRRGDSLYTISKKYGTTIALLKKANGLSRGMIRIGQKLKIPSKRKLATKKTAKKRVTKKKSKKFVTKRSRIKKTAKKKIVRTLAARKINVFSYTVKRGDTLWSVAKKFRVPLKKLLSTNLLSRKAILYAGRKIKIPRRKTSY